MRVTQLYAFEDVSVVRALELANAKLRELAPRGAVLRTFEIEHQRSDSIGGKNVILIVAIEMDDESRPSGSSAREQRG